jgi:hypothetical protein
MIHRGKCELAMIDDMGDLMGLLREFGWFPRMRTSQRRSLVPP